MNLDALLKAKSAWKAFNANHPKFMPFLNTLKERGAVEGAVVEISVSYPDGSNVKTNLQVKEGDVALVEVLRGL